MDNNLVEKLASYINELKPTFVDINMEVGLRSVDQALDKLYKAIANPNTNRKLFTLLYDQAKKSNNDIGVHFAPLDIEIARGRKVPTYLYLMMDRPDRGRSSLGQSRGRKEFFWRKGEGSVALGLYGDAEQEMLVWHQGYEQTLIHEVTHVYQALSVAIRKIQMDQGKDKPVSSKKVMSILPNAMAHRATGKILRPNGKRTDDPEEKVISYIKYISTSTEIGANAHALANLMLKQWGPNALESVGNMMMSNRDSLFDEIDADLQKGINGIRSNVWDALTDLEQREVRILRRNRRDTDAREIKKRVLMAAYEYYKRQYAKRR